MGGVFASRVPAVVKTVVGACVAVCLFDPEARVGGMAHLMLPVRLDRQGDQRSSYYGLYLMDLLVNEMMKYRAERCRLQAQVFGAALLLQLGEQAQVVSMRNAAFITSYLKIEGVPLLSQDLGGDCPRAVYFYSDTGRSLVKRPKTITASQIAIRERQYESELVRSLEEPSDGITIF